MQRSLLTESVQKRLTYLPLGGCEQPTNVHTEIVYTTSYQRIKINNRALTHPHNESISELGISYVPLNHCQCIVTTVYVYTRWLFGQGIGGGGGVQIQIPLFFVTSHTN